jgi:glycogen operon protein
MGDEVRRTQQGNNNAYCQDNEMSWFDWTLLEKHGEIFRFVKHLIAMRLQFGLGRTDADTLQTLLEQIQIEFGGVTPGVLDEGYTSHALAMARRSPSGSHHFYLMANSYWEPLTFALPMPPDAERQGWRRVIDTSQASPDDVHSWEDAPVVDATTYPVGPRTIVLFATSEAA